MIVNKVVDRLFLYTDLKKWIILNREQTFYSLLKIKVFSLNQRGVLFSVLSKKVEKL